MGLTRGKSYHGFGPKDPDFTLEIQNTRHDYPWVLAGYVT